MRIFQSSLKQSRIALIETLLLSVCLLVCARENYSVSRGIRLILRKAVSPSASSFNVRRKRTALTTLPTLPKAASRARSSRPRSALNISVMKSGDRRDLNPYSCRHTTATEAVKKGVELPVVQQIMRHSKLSSTQRYIHVSTEAAHKAINSLNRTERPKDSEG